MTRIALHAAGAALLLAVAVPCAAQDLGRLFLTPEQREILDGRRRARVPDKPTAVVVESPVTQFDGHVARSSGRSTLWFGGQLLRDGVMPEGIQIAPRRDAPGRVSIRLRDSDASVDLKVGQALVRETGEIRDPLNASTAPPEQDAGRSTPPRDSNGAANTSTAAPAAAQPGAAGPPPALAAPPPIPRKY